MGDSYKHKFNVLEVFEKNDYQNILMGTKKDSIDDVVVINVFKKGFLINDKFLNDLKNSLSNLIHIEENDSEIIAVTEYREGISFSNFLSTTNLNLDERVHLIHQYLTNLTNYDVFDDYFTNIFVDENQIISKNGEFHLNELLILDKGIEEETSFDKIRAKISSTIRKISNDSDEIDKSSDDYKKFSEFNDKLQNLTKSDLSIANILGVFEETFSNKEFKSVKTSSSKATLVNSLGAATAAASIAASSPTYGEGAEDNSIEENIEENAPIENHSDKVEDADISDQVHMDNLPKADDQEEFISDDQAPVDDIEMSDSQNDIMTETELDNILVVDENQEAEVYRDNTKKKRGIILAVIVALLAALAIFALPNLFTKDEAPTASFERVTFEDSIRFVNTSIANGKNNEIVAALWKVVKDEEVKYSSDNLDAIKLSFKSEGEYIVSLKVQDKNGLWSEEYFETILSAPEDNVDTSDPITSDTKEKLDSVDIDISSSSNVTYDSVIYRSGNKSIKFDLTQNDGIGEFILNDLNLEKNTTLSMWILSDKTEAINIEYTGYSGNNVKFVKEVNYTPKFANSWDLLELKMNSTGVDKLKLKFKSLGSTIWIDDIDTSSYK